MNPEDIFIEAMKNIKPFNKDKVNFKKSEAIFITIDLHNKTLQEAINIIDYNITRMTKDKIKLKIITGKGRHSDTIKPVLVSEVKNYLVEKGLKYKEKEGYFEVW